MKKRRTIFKEEILLLFVVISLACSQDTDLTVTLQRVIGSGSDWSIGYKGDFYIATVNSSFVDKFRWNFNDEVEEQQFDPITGTCRVNGTSSNATSFSASCEGFAGEMRSIMHLNRELQSDDGGFVEFYVEESSIHNTTRRATFNVKECSSSSPLLVSSVDAKYNSAGNFYCDNGGDLYNSSTGRKVENTVTTCQADGTWKDADVVQCWKAPENVNITGNFAIKEEVELSLTCEFDDSSDDVPHVDSFVFYKNGIAIYHGNTATFNTHVTRNDNRATVQCKAENIVNENSNDLRGVSQKEILIVYYKPTTPEIELLNPNNLIIENNKEILMRSDQSLSINCDVDSNPSAKCTWKFQSNENVSNECETTIKLETSGVLECQATNEQYTDVATNHVMVTLVDETREPTIYEQDNPKEQFDVKENSSLTVECRVDYEDELGTTFNWIFSDQNISPNKTLELTGIKPTDDGDYYCCTKDDFGENSNKFSLNVLFSPRKSKTTNEDEENNISFTWIEDSNGECQIDYYSNPVAENLVLTKNGTVVEWSLLTIQITQDKRQTLTIQKNKVTQSDKGNYSLEISSYLFPDDSMTIEFEIIVESSSSPNKAVIISCSCVGAVILISVGLFVFYRMKIKKKDTKKTKTASTESARKEVDSNIDPYSTYQPSQDNTVEQKDEDERMDYVNVKSIPMSSNQNVYIN